MGNLKIEYLQISDLIPYANNPRKNDEAVEYDTAKMYMNNILRSMQMTTAQELREIVKNG